MAVKRVDCFFWKVEDKTGVLAQFARRLRDEKINRRGLWGYTNNLGNGRIGCVPQNSKKFLDSAKRLGLTTVQRTALHVSGPDKVGSLCKVLDVLEAAGVNIDTIDGMGFSGRFGAYIWLDPKDVEKAAKALKI